jgi:rare lipoprotein A
MLKKPFIYFCCLSLLLVSCHRKLFPGSGGEKITETGYASYYSDKFEGSTTANGEIFHQSKLTAAHKKIAFGTVARVTNLNTNKSVIVHINDRGPFIAGRIIDLSKSAASHIKMIDAGVVKVKIEYRKK